jgi:VCBS repeat-containing protein
MATFTIGSRGNFATITAALASGSGVVPGDTLALLSGYSNEIATVGIENLTFSGDASNTGIQLWLSTGIVAVSLTGTAPIAITGNSSDNSITGNDGSNVLAGGGGNDSINGGAGADTIYYQVGDDFSTPGDGIDTIDGGPDHDTLNLLGSTGFDDGTGKGFGGNNYLNVVVVDGAITSIGTVANIESVVLDLGEGDDVDTLDYAGTMEAVTVNLAIGTATGFTSIAGVEYVFGGSGNDALTGDAYHNILAGGDGLDTLTGGDGFDSLDGGDGADSLDGGAGDDWLIRGGIGFDTLTGGTGVDRFEGDLSELNGDRITDYEAGDRIVLEGSLAGYDNVRLVATGADTGLQIDGNNDGSFETVITLNGTISGTISIGSEPYTNKVNNVIRIVTPSSAVPTSGSDILVGTPAADTIDGLAGDDEIFGLAGNDTFIGGTGSDTLYGSYGNDDLSGGADNDALFGDSGADTLEGGGGYDALFGGDGDDVLTDSGYDVNSAYGADAYMDGGAGNDILRATGGRSELHGGADSDTLIGGTAGSYGWDYLLGEDGNDTLLGNGDRDVLTGGPGADTFAFVLTTDSAVGNPDVITDWESSDKIDLAAIDANTSLDGNQDFTFLGLGAADDWTVGQGQLKYYHHVGDTWVVGNVTADNQVDFADFQIRINGLYSLTADQIQGINNAPVATADSYSTNEDESLNIAAAAGVLLNDTDADNDPLTAVLVSDVQHGTLALNANGSFRYTPEANYNGPDRFSYGAFDGDATSNVTTVSITVDAVNDAPVALADAYSTAFQTRLTIDAAKGVLQNDRDIDGNSIAAELVTPTAHGMLTLNADGSFSYVPDANYHGTDSFVYHATDGVADSNDVTVQINVGARTTRDFNGDGKSDIPLQNDSGQVYFWEMNGLLTNGEGSVLHAPVTRDWHFQGTGDFDGDGKSDLLWRHDSGQVYLWEMDGLQIKGEGSPPHAPVPNDWHIEGTDDFNGDGNSDILWRHDSGQVYLWEMNGLQVKAEGAVAHASVPKDWHVQGMGDFNGDGSSDILWWHDSGQVYLWEMDGQQIKGEGSPPHAPVPNDWHIQGVGDFDGDGKSALLWRHDNGQVYIWEMNGSQVKAEGTVVHAGVPNDWHVQDVGDFNGDGNSDILWRHDSGQLYVWEMNGLQVEDEGTVVHAAVPNDWHILA